MGTLKGPEAARRDIGVAESAEARRLPTIEPALSLKLYRLSAGALT